MLMIGAWFATVASLNESLLLGLGKPAYNFASSGLKLIFLIVTIDASFYYFGSVGLIATVAVSELFRYVPTCFGQIRERFSFVGQDLWLTAGMAICVVMFESLRWVSGFGTSFDAIKFTH
jgi:hypothetical protein